MDSPLIVGTFAIIVQLRKILPLMKYKIDIISDWSKQIKSMQMQKKSNLNDIFSTQSLETYFEDLALTLTLRAMFNISCSTFIF